MPTTAPSKILIIRLSALGDVIQTLPVLAQLRQKFPHATLGWLVEADAADLLRDNPLLDRLHISHRKRWMKSLKNPLSWGQTIHEARAFLGEIKAEGYDVALDFQGLFKSGLTLLMTGIQRRIGLSCAREMAPMFYTEKVPPDADFFDPAVPIIQHFECLTRALGCTTGELQYPLPNVKAGEAQVVTDLLKAFSVDRPWVILAPATQWESKHWPSPYWAQLIELILSKTDLNVALVGGRKDGELIRNILQWVPEPKQEGRIADLAGKTSLSGLQALLEMAQAVIGLDSAPLHLAGAVGKSRLIGLYGPTAYRRSHPPGKDKVTLLSSESKLACQPCDKTVCPLGTLACMHHITPADVFSALMQQIEVLPAPPH